jgi:hypothetical protein
MKYALLALFLFACTLIAPLWAWACSGRRAAWEAWKGFAAWFGGVLLVGAIVALFML